MFTEPPFLWLTSLPPSPALRPYLSSGCQSSSSLLLHGACRLERPCRLVALLVLNHLLPIRVTQSVPCNKWPHPVIGSTCVYLSKAMVVSGQGSHFINSMWQITPCSRSHALSVFLNQRAPNPPPLSCAWPRYSGRHQWQCRAPLLTSLPKRRWQRAFLPLSSFSLPRVQRLGPRHPWVGACVVCFSSDVLAPREVLSMSRSLLLTGTTVLRGVACELPAPVVLEHCECIRDACSASPVD